MKVTISTIEEEFQKSRTAGAKDKQKRVVRVKGRIAPPLPKGKKYKLIGENKDGFIPLHLRGRYSDYDEYLDDKMEYNKPEYFTNKQYYED